MSTRLKLNRCIVVMVCVCMVVSVLLLTNVFAKSKEDSFSKKGLVGYWAFDEGKGFTVSDASGKGNHGKIRGNPEWVKGKVGKALMFDGKENYVEVVYDKSLDLPDAITISAWIKPFRSETPKSKGMTILSRRKGMDCQYSLYLIAKKLELKGGWEGSFRSSGAKVKEGKWVHVVMACTTTPTKLRFYINGEEVSNQVMYKLHKISTSSNLIIGRRSDWKKFYFHGAIDELMIFNHALSSKEIQHLYTIGSGEAIKKNEVGEERSGNIPVNGSFERGIQGWEFAPSRMKDRYSIDTDNAVHAQRCLRVDRIPTPFGRHSLRKTGVLKSLWMNLAIAKPYIIRFKAKSLASGPSITVALRDSAGIKSSFGKISLTPEWQDIKLKGKLNIASGKYVYLVINFFADSSAVNSIFLDDVKIIPDKNLGTDKNAVEFSIVTGDENNLFIGKKPFGLKARVFNLTDKTVKGKLTYTIRRFPDTPVRRKSADVSLPAGKEKEIPIPFNSLEYGFYDIKAYLDLPPSGKKIITTSRFARIEKVPVYNNPTFFRGMYLWSLKHWSMQEIVKTPKLLRRYGINLVRVEVPTDNSLKKWSEKNYPYFELHLKNLKENKIHCILRLPILHRLYSRSYWGKGWEDRKYVFNFGVDPNKKEYFVNEDELEYWSKVIKNFARRYSPYPTFWLFVGECENLKGKDGRQVPIEDKARIQKCGYNAIKSVDKDALVMLGTTAGLEPSRIRFIDEYLKALESTPGNYMDCLEYHPYRSHPEIPNDYAKSIDLLHKTMRKHGVGNIPVVSGEFGFRRVWIPWSGESEGWYSATSCGNMDFLIAPGEDIWSSYVSRMFLTDQAKGVKGSVYFHWNPTRWITCAAVSSAYLPTPGLVAIATQGVRLGQAVPIRQLKVGSALRGFLFRKDKHKIAVLWAVSKEVKDGKLKLSAKELKNIRAYTFLNRRINIDNGILPVTLYPIYIEAPETVALDFLIETASITNIGPPLEVGVCAKNNRQLELELCNKSNIILGGDVKLFSEDIGLDTKFLRFKIGAGDRETILFNAKKSISQKRIKVVASVRLNTGEKYSFDNVLNPIFCHRIGTRIKVDGDLSDWEGISPISMGKDALVDPRNTVWKGEKDLSANLYLGWDKKHFYMAVDVKDNIHFTDEKKMFFWQGDCIQIYLDTLKDATQTKSAFDENDYEYNIWLSPYEGAVLKRGVCPDWELSRGLNPGMVSKSMVKRAIKRIDGRTIYEISFPQDQLFPFELKKSSMVKFAIGINDNDGLKGQPGIAGKTKRKTKHLSLIPNGIWPYKNMHLLRGLTLVK